jgi:hypothetical protein
MVLDQIVLQLLMLAFVLKLVKSLHEAVSNPV